MLSARESNAIALLQQVIANDQSTTQHPLQRLHIIRAALANPDIQLMLINNEANELQATYQQTIVNLTNELQNLSRYLFVNLTDLDNPDTKPEERPASHTQMINAFESLSAMIIYDILNHDELSERVIAMTNWITIMQNCFDAGDFYTTKVINTALNALPILKLTNTRANLSHQAKSILTTMTELVEKPAAMYSTMTKPRGNATIPFYIEYKNMFGGLKELDKDKAAVQKTKLSAELSNIQTIQKPLNTIHTRDALSAFQLAIINGSKLNQEEALIRVEQIEPKNIINANTVNLIPTRLTQLLIPEVSPLLIAEQARIDQTKKQKNIETIYGFISTYERKIQENKLKIETLIVELKKYQGSLDDGKLDTYRRIAIQEFLVLASNFHSSTESRVGLFSFFVKVMNDKVLFDHHLGVGTLKKIKGDKPTIIKYFESLKEAYANQQKYIDKLTELTDKLEGDALTNLSAFSLSLSRSGSSISFGSHSSGDSNSSSYIRREMTYQSARSVRIEQPVESRMSAADASIITPLELISATTQSAPPAVTLTTPTPRAPLTRSSSVREARTSVLIPKAVAEASVNPPDEEQKQKAEKKPAQKSLSRGLRVSMQNLFSSDVKKNTNTAPSSPTAKSSKP